MEYHVSNVLKILNTRQKEYIFTTTSLLYPVNFYNHDFSQWNEDETT